jgi:hypothetical protein
MPMCKRVKGLAYPSQSYAQDQRRRGENAYQGIQDICGPDRATALLSRLSHAAWVTLRGSSHPAARPCHINDPRNPCGVTRRRS